MLVLATVSVHETSLANQNFILGRGGVCKKDILCILMKMLKIMDGPLGISHKCWLLHGNASL